jgi:hypothetical protein
MTDIVELYCRIVNEGAGFDDPRLVQLRACMTEEELERVEVLLISEAGKRNGARFFTGA